MADTLIVKEIPLALRIAAPLAVLLIVAYAVVTGQVLLGLLTILVLVVLALAVYLCYLFYRLVIAVERIAYGE